MAKSTINAGLDCLSGGDSLIIGGGTYDEMIVDAIPSGAPGAHTLVKAAAGEAVWIQPNRPTEHVVFFRGFHHITLDGINIDLIHHPASDIRVSPLVIRNGDNNHDILIQNFEIKNTEGDGEAGIVVGDTSYNITIRNGHIHDIAESNCFYVRPAHSMIIEDMILHDCGDNGISLFSQAASPVLDNILRNNYIYRNGYGSERGGGITLGRSTQNSLVYNNVIFNSGVNGIKEMGGRGNKLYNNTIYDNGQDGIRLLSGTRGALIKNNLIYSNNALTINDMGSGNTKESNFTANPGFADAAAGDFRLKADSPAIDAGVALSEVPDDLDGTSRPQGSAYDIGAYEYTEGGSEPLLGDLDGDEDRDLADLRLLIKMIVGQIPQDLERGDLDGDEALTVADVRALIQILVAG